jgi:Family of unknown function (DUF6208)
MNGRGEPALRQTSTGRLTAAICEIVLAPLSFLFYRVTRFGMQRLVQAHDRANPAQATTWRTLDAPAVRKPFNLLALMTSAPRWNTHALIALAGPLQVRRTVAVQTATAAKSAEAWTVVVHSEPTHRIVASVGSLDAVNDDPWRVIELPPGAYRLALRYYRWSAAAKLPAVEIDGMPALRPLAVAADINDFYHGLARHSSFLYLSLHSYVCTLLRYRRWFPRSFVEREYLPAGNPQMTFHYGFLRAGTRLVIEMDAGLLRTHDVYFTAYNRASFPVFWYPLTETRHSTARIPAAGTYLIRVHAKASAQDCDEGGTVRIHAVRENSRRERADAALKNRRGGDVLPAGSTSAAPHSR